MDWTVASLIFVFAGALTFIQAWTYRFTFAGLTAAAVRAFGELSSGTSAFIGAFEELILAVEELEGRRHGLDLFLVVCRVIWIGKKKKQLFNYI